MPAISQTLVMSSSDGWIPDVAIPLIHLLGSWSGQDVDDRRLDGLVLLKEFRRHVHLSTGVISRMTNDKLDAKNTIQAAQ